jgi:hypothetical protein
MSRSSQNITNLTVQNIYPLNADSSFVPALRTLTSDGTGGTYWAVPSSLGGYPSFNSVVVDNVPIPALASTNTLYLSSATGIGMAVAPATNRIDIFSKSFGAFAVSSGNTLVAFSNSVVTPTVNIIGTSGIRIDANPLTQTLTFSGMPTAVSTGQYGYNQVNVISNATQPVSSTYLTASSPSTVLNVMGTGDVLLTANVTTNTWTIGISTFTSANYLATSSISGNAYPCTMSTVSTLFYDIPRSVSTTGSVISLMSNMSTNIQTKFQAVEQNVQDNYVTKGLYTYSTNTIIGALNTQAGVNANFLTNLFSTFTIVSTLGVTGTYASGTVSTFGTGGAAGALYGTFSSSSFRLDSVSSLLKMANTIQLTFSPSYLFGATNTSPWQMVYMSTTVIAGRTILSNVNFTRPWMVTNTGSTSNLYTDTITLTLPYNQVSSSLLSSYSLFHTISPFAPSGTGIQSLTYMNYIDPNNSLRLLLTGNVFRGLQ